MSVEHSLCDTLSDDGSVVRTCRAIIVYNIAFETQTSARNLSILFFLFVNFLIFLDLDVGSVRRDIVVDREALRSLPHRLAEVRPCQRTRLSGETLGKLEPGMLYRDFKISTFHAMALTRVGCTRSRCIARNGHFPTSHVLGIMFAECDVARLEFAV